MWHSLVSFRKLDVYTMFIIFGVSFEFVFDKLTKFLIFNLTLSNLQAINHFKIVRKVVKLLGVHQDGTSALHIQYR